jgi:hypothetical protein
MNKLTRLAPDRNAYTIPFAENLLNEIRESYRRELQPILTLPQNQILFEGGRAIRQTLGAATGEYFATSYKTHPLLWFSTHTPHAYQIYRRFFDNLGIEDEVKALVDHDRKIVMYCGFLVIGAHISHHSWHVDYFPGANAYSLLTPLFPLEPGHGNLLYTDLDQRAQRYSYAMGEAIMFGENFPHCTEPYAGTGGLRVLVTLQFGTDKLQHWPVLRQTIESQSEYLILPCGHKSGTCECAGVNVPAAQT